MKQKIQAQDFAQWLSENGNIDKKTALSFVRTFFQTIEQGLAKDQIVKIKGLGTFKLVTVNERESVNINTGERFQIGEHNKVTFTPDASMKEIINRPFAHFESVDLNDETNTAELEAVDEAISLEFPQVPEEEASTTESPISTTVEVLTESARPDSLTHEETPTVEVAAEQEKTEENETEIVTIDGTLTEETETEEAKTGTTETEETNTDAAIRTGTSGSEDTDTTSAPDNPEETSPAPEEQAEQAVLTAEKSAPADTDAEIGVSQPTTLTVSGTNPEEEEQRCPWVRRTLTVLFVLLLCTASYFVGYYRLLCPPCAPIAPAKPATKVQTDSAQTKNPQSSEKDSSTVSAAPQTVSTTPTEAKDSVKQEKTEEKAVTRTHTIRMGDNLSRIARKYYGDDHYVDFIIRKNNLKNADNIHVGKVLVLPPLDAEKGN